MDLNDTLVIFNNSEVYNIKPWLEGGVVQLAWDMQTPLPRFELFETNQGTRILSSITEYNVTIFPVISATTEDYINIYNPFDHDNNYPLIYSELTDNGYKGIAVANDTIYYGKRIVPNIFTPWVVDLYLIAAKVENDIVTKIDSVKLPLGFLNFSEISGISVEDGLVAVCYGKQIGVYKWNGNQLEELFNDYLFARNAKDILMRNRILYVADQFFGLRVYDISSLSQAVYVGETKGTGGWMNVFGSQSVHVCDVGYIYLSDFIGGVFIIEPYDYTPVLYDNTHKPLANNIFSVFPNPAYEQFTIEFTDDFDTKNMHLKIYDITGRDLHSEKINNRNSITINSETWRAGLYFVSIVDGGRIVKSERIIIK